MRLLNRLRIMPVIAGMGLVGLVGCEEDYPPSDYTMRTETGIKLTPEASEWLEQEGVPKDVSSAYDERFLMSAQNIPLLFKRGLTPDVANEYDERFGEWEVEKLHEAGISSFSANPYDKRFNSMSIEKLQEAGISPEVANNYDFEAFAWYGSITDAVKFGLNSEKAQQYDARFRGDERVNLHKNGVTPKRASQYHNSFSDDDIVALHNADIPIETANRFRQLNEQFGAVIDSADIIQFVEGNVPYETVANRAEELILDSTILNKHSDR